MNGPSLVLARTPPQRHALPGVACASDEPGTAIGLRGPNAGSVPVTISWTDIDMRDLPPTQVSERLESHVKTEVEPGSSQRPVIRGSRVVTFVARNGGGRSSSRSSGAWRCIPARLTIAVPERSLVQPAGPDDRERLIGLFAEGPRVGWTRPAPCSIRTGKDCRLQDRIVLKPSRVNK